LMFESIEKFQNKEAIRIQLTGRGKEHSVKF
jgi:hypothetical protein